MTKWTSVCKSRKYKDLGKLVKVEFRKVDFRATPETERFP